MMRDPQDIAVELFGGGLNCAEAVVTALLEVEGRHVAEAQRLATAFGGGMARRGMVCGCLSGGAMALGALLGRSTPEDAAGKDRAYAAVDRLLTRVEDRFGSVLCRTLTGLDFALPGSHEEFDRRVKAQVCVPLVRFTVGAVLDELRWSARRLPETGKENP